MKSTPLIINWHDQNAPIYSAHFEPHGKGRLATAGGDNNVRLWKVDSDGEHRRVEYLATLTKHTQAVNVVRWSPKSELLASAGDDGNVILWVPAESNAAVTSFGSDANLDDKETWRTKHMCRSSGAEIYDLAWSPDGMYFIIGSMDNIARIYNAATGSLVRQIAEHSHYVQGVAWDPLNEYIATQSSDRSVHIYSLKTKDGQYTLSNGLGGSVDDKTGATPSKVASHAKADLPPRRLASQSPAPSDISAPLTAASLSASLAAASHRSQLAAIDAAAASTGPASMSSPVPSAPGTPTSFALPMNPPSVISHSHSHSRRSSFSSSRRSVSPAPSMPLPAVMPMEASPKPPTSMGVGGLGLGMSVKNASLYANETLTSFFRRLTFTPDGSLLLTPAGQYQTQHQAEGAAKPSYEITNTVYIYSRGGINKAPIAHLPGHKKPSVAVRCSPTIYTLRQSPSATKHITIDTSSAEDPIPALPEPLTAAAAAAGAAKPAASPSVPSTPSVMDPPPPPTPKNEKDASTTPTLATATMASPADTATPNTAAPAAPAAPKSAFALAHRMIYAVATQDSVLLYDTQQQTPICVVSNLHCATFTDLAWASDGLTLLISSSDGFCSTLSFAPGELGQPFTGELPSASAPTSAAAAASASASTPSALLRHHRSSASASSLSAPSPPVSFVSSVSSAPPPLLAPTPVSIPASTTASFMSARPSSPARSNSTSSIITQASAAPATASQSASQSASASQAANTSQPGMNNPQLVVGAVPSLSASGSLKALQAQAAAAASVGQTPPQTPRNRANSAASSVSVANSVVGVPPAISAVPASASASASASTATVPAKREAGDDKDKDKDEQAPKKRRIAPTLVSSLDGEVS